MSGDIVQQAADVIDELRAPLIPSMEIAEALSAAGLLAVPATPAATGSAVTVTVEQADAHGGYMPRPWTGPPPKPRDAGPADPVTPAVTVEQADEPDDYVLVLREDFDLVRACVDNDHWPVKFHHLAVGVLLDNAQQSPLAVDGVST